jgi:hypothetical protein
VSEPADVDALFKLPLGEFTSARNALSAQLKKAGRPQEAADVKVLTKPSVSAWAVNQLYWRHRKLFDRLLDTGERVRRAQLAGASTREPNDARRAAVAELTEIVEALLREGEYGATRDLLRRVTTTLEALASFHGLPNAPVAGRLVDDVEPPGFDAIAGLMEPAAKLPRRTEQAPAPKKRDDGEGKRLLAAANAAVRDAERALDRARKHAERAAAGADAAAARAKALEAQRVQLERQLDLAAQAAAEAADRARKAAAGASEANAEADSAERALEVARRGVQQPTRA